MNNPKYSFEQVKIPRHLLYWTTVIVPVSIAAGSLVALFLWLLDLATVIRWQTFASYSTHAAAQNRGRWLTILLKMTHLVYPSVGDWQMKEISRFFFRTHKEILKDNTVICKEAGFWEYKD